MKYKLTIEDAKGMIEMKQYLISETKSNQFIQILTEEIKIWEKYIGELKKVNKV